MRLCILFPMFCMCLSQPVYAEEWVPLDDAGINAALTARVLSYEDGSTQNFFADGRTLFEVSSGESWGKWWVEDGQYCSTWAPSPAKTCYVVASFGMEISFTDQAGKKTIGHYIDLN